MKCPECGKELKPNKYDAPITIKTYNFPLEVLRNVYYCRDCKVGMDPLYDIFDLYKNHKLTIGLTLEIVREAQIHSSFEESQQEIKHHLDLDISESIIVDVAEDVGNEIHKDEIEKAESIFENYQEYIPDVKEENKEDCILYIMADGSMLSIINEDGTCSWKENKLGIIFKDNKLIEQSGGKNMITEKEYVSYLGSCETFKKMLFKAAINNDYGKVKKVVFIGDGAPWLWNICDELFPDAEQILDFYHLKENLYDYAEYLHPENESEQEKWVANTQDKIVKGNVEEVIDDLPEVDDEIKENQDIPNLKQYLKNNKNKVNYQEYRDKNYFIGSGSIESGHGKVIHQRLKQPGMHWSHKGCQGMTSLRTKYCSNQWGKVVDMVSAKAA